MLDRELAEFAGRLDRGFFIDNEYKSAAYLDRPLPIGWGQTISQPTLVLEMTRLLSPEKESRVLEIGTGSGYQTALLARFSGHVYTVERIPELSRRAKERLEALGFENITFRIGDGSLGWSEHAPYDRIIVTAAAGTMPPELIEQMSEDGIMIIPVGPPQAQRLQLVRKDRDGGVRVRTVEEVRFVEMKGRYGWRVEGADGDEG